MTQPNPDNLPNPTPAAPPEKPENKPVIRGEVLPLEDLLNYAEIDLTDLESAAQWWDDTASPDWTGALDRNPVNVKRRTR